jgi:transposase
MTTRPNYVVELLPAFCEKCCGSLVEHAGEVGMERRQVMDPPPPSGLETTEYQAIKLRCAECGHVTKPAFPEWAKAPVQYGPRLHAMASYLAVHQYMPYERMVLGATVPEVRQLLEVVLPAWSGRPRSRSPGSRTSNVASGLPATPTGSGGCVSILIGSSQPRALAAGAAPGEGGPA